MSLEDRFAYNGFRPGQKELARRIYEACLSRQVLVAEAMSGFGKTAAVLSGTLTAAEETVSKVLYACRTKRQIHRVVAEVTRLQKKHPFKAASMLSKFDYCLLRRNREIPRESFGWYCSFNVSNNLCSYFMNIPFVAKDFDNAVSRFLHETPSQENLLRESEIIHVCPYEVARLALVQADVAIVPYHYVFEPKATSMLFDRNSMERHKTILVVDEAHNLRDFVKGLHSATLTLDQVQGAVREAQAMMMDEAAASLRILGQTLEKVILDHKGWRVDQASILGRFRSDQGTAWLQNLVFELSSCSGAAWGSITYERRLPSLILQVGDFLSKLSSSPESILVTWENKFGLVNPNPVAGLESYLGEFRSSILVSATINPSSVFLRSIGLSASGIHAYEVSDEPMVTVRTAVDTGVSTRYKSRSPEMFTRISDRVAAVISATNSGVGVFPPSYSVLRVIHDLVAEKVSGRKLVCESPGLSSQEAADLFDAYGSGGNSVLFAVQGGRFSEGEDFNEGMMDAVVVVGLQLPPPSPMLFAEYASLKNSGEPDSYLMLSRLPALRKAFQAAGRHIRTPGKRGLVVLMDDRFNSYASMDLMPSWLKKDLVIGDFGSEGLGTLTREFWANQA